MSKRPAADNANNESSDDDTRAEKLSKNSTGGTVTLYSHNLDDTKAITRDTVASCVENIAKTLVGNPNGEGERLFNSSTVGTAIKHLVNAVIGRPDQYPMVDDDDVAAYVTDAISTDPLDDERIKAVLTNGIIQALQDPLWSRDANDPDPVMMVGGMRKDVGSSIAHNGRKVSPIMLTLLDGSGLQINARVAVVRTDEVGGLRRGYVIKLKEFIRIFVARYSNRYSSAAIGLIDYSVVGAGQVPAGADYSAHRQSRISSLLEQTAATLNVNSNISNENCDPLQGWDESKRRPPVPEEKCTVGNRTCSDYGTHFFAKCVCEEYPVAERNLEELRKNYFGADREVLDMTPSMKRNMLYWCYATDVYHVRGWQNRMPLPPCLVFEIRKMYPNEKDVPYEGYHDAASTAMS